MRILAISGSLRSRSTNTELLVALASLAPADVVVELYDGLDRLPHFNPDLEATEPEAVMDLKRRLASADGLVISSPDYARGVPGSLKNALDWLVLLGVAGSWFGSWVFGLLGFSGRVGFIGSVIGATLLLLVARWFRNRN